MHYIKYKAFKYLKTFHFYSAKQCQAHKHTVQKYCNITSSLCIQIDNFKPLPAIYINWARPISPMVNQRFKICTQTSRIPWDRKAYSLIAKTQLNGIASDVKKSSSSDRSCPNVKKYTNKISIVGKRWGFWNLLEFLKKIRS